MPGKFEYRAKITSGNSNSRSGSSTGNSSAGGAAGAGRPQKFLYTRPQFLNLKSEDEILVSADHQIRPIILPRDVTRLPWECGYAECINAGKSTRNEDQAAIHSGTIRCKISKSTTSTTNSSYTDRIADFNPDPPLNNSSECSETTERELPYKYFAIFDGHAGSAVAVAAAAQLHEIIISKLRPVAELLIHNELLKTTGFWHSSTTTSGDSVQSSDDSSGGSSSSNGCSHDLKIPPQDNHHNHPKPLKDESTTDTATDTDQEASAQKTDDTEIVDVAIDSSSTNGSTSYDKDKVNDKVNLDDSDNNNLNGTSTKNAAHQMPSNSPTKNEPPSLTVDQTIVSNNDQTPPNPPLCDNSNRDTSSGTAPAETDRRRSLAARIGHLQHRLEPMASGGVIVSDEGDEGHFKRVATGDPRTLYPSSIEILCLGLNADDLIKGALESAFWDMDKLIARDKQRFKMPGGCTAVVSLFICGKLFVCNAGDSRAIVHKNNQVIAMSEDFTPVSERKRISRVALSQPELMGNEFTHLEFVRRPTRADLGKQMLYRDAFMTGWAMKTITIDDLKFPLIHGEGKRSRALATIGVTRGFGDHELRSPYGSVLIKPFLTSEPEIKVIGLAGDDRLSADDVLIMGSDGLWDVTSNSEAAEIVSYSFNFFPGNDESRAKYRYITAAQDLVIQSRGHTAVWNNIWRTHDGRMASMDDIAVFVIPLKNYRDEYLAWLESQELL